MEFALVLPLVVLLLLALLQVGLLLRDQLLVASAAREGAREAAVSSDLERIERAAARAAPGLEVSVHVERGSRRGDIVRVGVVAPPTALPVVGMLVSGKEVRSTATMRVERAGALR